MTQRLKYPNVWAQSGTATDPDTDTTNPSYEANKYADIGWKAEKPPEEWQNFITQLTDAKIVNFIADGIPKYDSSVTYPLGAVCQMTGKVYVHDTEATPPKAPPLPSSGWEEILDLQSASFNAKILDIRNLLTGHLSKENAHEDTIKTLIGGGYYKAEDDKAFGDATDPQTIVYHKLQMGGVVHKTTAAQIGALPSATGGVFTGDVMFLMEAIFQVTPSMYLHYNKATALMELVNGTHALGIDASGNGYITNGGGQALILSEANMTNIVIKYNNSFALPTPLLSMNLSFSMSDTNACGVWESSVAKVPVFHVNGGLKVDDNDVTFKNFNVGGTCDIYVRGRTTAGAEVIVLSQGAPTANYTSMATLLTNVGATTMVYVMEVVVYPNLTSYQKSMLVL